MCQCLICDCWWCNFCGVCCAGLSEHYLCCSYWCCKPDDLKKFNDKCCICFDGFEGFGGNCFCQGNVCCAPDYLKKWSVFRTTGAVGNAPMPRQGTY